MKKIFILTASIFLLTACSFLSPVKDAVVNTYELSAIPNPPVKHAARKINLLVAPIETTAAFDTAQMAYSVQPYAISYFAKNTWVNTPAQMLRPLIIQTLQKSRYFNAVVPAPTLGNYTWVLSTQLMSLKQVFYGHGSEIELGLRAQLIDAATGRIIATRQFSVTEKADPTPYGGVVAANKAVEKLLLELTRFCINRK